MQTPLIVGARTTLPDGFELVLTSRGGRPLLAYNPLLDQISLLAPTVAGSGDGGTDGPAAPATYLEGTFEPRLTSTLGSADQAYAVQKGQFARIGNLVWIAGRLALAARGTFPGDVLLKGMPFPVVGLEGEDLGAVMVAAFQGLTVPKAGLQGLPKADTNAIALLGTTSSAQSAPVAEADLGDDFGITFGGWYVTE
jgi:hypothetical protein